MDNTTGVNTVHFSDELCGVLSLVSSKSRINAVINRLIPNMAVLLNFHNNYFNPKLTHIAGDVYPILGSRKNWVHIQLFCVSCVGFNLPQSRLCTTVAANYCTNFPLGNSTQGYYD